MRMNKIQNKKRRKVRIFPKTIYFVESKSLKTPPNSNQEVNPNNNKSKSKSNSGKFLQV